MSQNKSSTEKPLVPDHELLRKVGGGSYGDVWLARNVMGSYRAVKVVYRSFFDSDRPFEREFQGLQKFEPFSRTHPGLVSILHAGRNAEQGYFYCVMEVADDSSTGQAIEPENYQPRTLAGDLGRRGRLSLEESLDLGIHLAAAMEHLHSKGLVHRDIKPSNIIFAQGIAKFADVGLVTQIGSRATFVGTEGYIAPEGPGTPEADIYGFGKVLYEVSMGKPPDQFPELPAKLREMPDWQGLMSLNTVILRCCDTQVARRFHSAGQLGEALRELRPAGSDNVPVGASVGTGVKVAVLFNEHSSLGRGFASKLRQQLARAGYNVWLMEAPALNTEWARELEYQLGKSRVIMPVISEALATSPAFAYAFEFGRQAAARTVPGTLLVPVLLGSPKSVPRNMALALESAPGLVVHDPGDPLASVESVVTALSGRLRPDPIASMSS